VAVSLFRSVVQVFSVRVVGAVVQFLGFAAFARALGASTFGMFLLYNALLGVLNAGADLGIGNAVQKRISERPGPTEARELFTTAALMKLATTLVAAGLVIQFRDLINAYIGSEVAWLLAPVLAIQQIGWLVSNTLHGELSIRTAQYLELVRRILFIGVGYLLIYLGYGVLGVIIGLASGWITLGVVGFWFCSAEIGRPSVSATRSLVRFSKYDFIPSTLRDSAYSWIDVVVIGFFLTQAHVAAYEMAWRVSGVVVLLSYAIGLNMFPQVSDWSTNDALERAERVVPEAITGSILFVIPAIVGAWFLGNDILRLVFGPEFTIATAALIVLLVGKLFEATNNVYAPVLQGLDRPELLARSAVVFLILNVVLNVVLIQFFGLVGAALATSAALAVYVGLNSRYVSRFLDFRSPSRETAALTLGALIMGIPLWVTRNAITIDTLPRLALVISIGGVVYFSVLSLTPRFRQRFKNAITR
jgi:O-antigen/teichoic acid export membrane protein